MNVFKVAISGKMGSGKTTTLNMLVEAWESGNGWVDGINCMSKTFKFATPIYEEAYKQGMSKDPEKKDRPLLLKIGLDGRKKDPYIWVTKALNAVENFEMVHSHCAGGDDCLIAFDDLRFPNEYGKLTDEKAWVTVRLNVSRETQIKRLKKCYPDTWETHLKNLDNYSETALDTEEGFDLIFDTEKLTTFEIVERISGFIRSKAMEKRRAEVYSMAPAEAPSPKRKKKDHIEWFKKKGLKISKSS